MAGHAGFVRWRIAPARLRVYLWHSHLRLLEKRDDAGARDVLGEWEVDARAGGVPG